MGNYGIKVSKPTFGVGTVTSLTDLVFTSGKNVLGVRQQSSYTGTTDSNGSISLAGTHNFGYAPICMVSVTTKDGEKVNVPATKESGWGKFEVLQENFGFYIGTATVNMSALVYHYEPVQGGSTTYLQGQVYTFNVIFFFNEINPNS